MFSSSDRKAATTGDILVRSFYATLTGMGLPQLFRALFATAFRDWCCAIRLNTKNKSNNNIGLF